MSGTRRYGRGREHDADVLPSLVHSTEITTYRTVAHVAQWCRDGDNGTLRGDAGVCSRGRRIGKVRGAMSNLTSPAFWTAVAGVITAVAGVIAVIRHVNGKNHQ